MSGTLNVHHTHPTPHLFVCDHAPSWHRLLKSGVGELFHFHLVCTSPMHLETLNKLYSPQEGFLAPEHFAAEFP